MLKSDLKRLDWVNPYCRHCDLAITPKRVEKHKSQERSGMGWSSTAIVPVGLLLLRSANVNSLIAILSLQRHHGSLIVGPVALAFNKEDATFRQRP